MADDTIAGLLRSRLAAIRNDPSLSPAEKRSRVQEELAMAQEATNEINAADAQKAGELSGVGKGAVAIDRAVNSAGFGLPSLIGDAVASIGGEGTYADRFKQVRADRADRNNQIGLAGLAADLVGGLATGSTVTKALASIPRLAKTGMALRAGIEGAGQGAIQGAADNLSSLDAEGAKSAAMGGGAGLALGATLGAGLGYGAGKAAAWLKGRSVAKDLMARGVNVEEAKVLARQLPSLSNESANAALARIEEMVKAGRGNEVMAADVLGGEGHNALRASTNISGEADQVARERIRTRDAGIVRRGRNDLAEATGYTPEQMDAHENAILGERKAKADVGYAKAREQGAAFDEKNPLDLRKKEVGEPPADPFEVGTVDPGAAQAQPKVPEHALTKEALADDVVRRKLSELAYDNPDKFKGVNPAEWSVMHSIYTNINKEIGQLKKSGNAVGEYYNGLVNAQRKLRSSLSARSSEFLPANADFAEYSRGLEAYQFGQDAASQAMPSDARRIVAEADPTQSKEVRKGFTDRLSELIGKGPNEDLGAAAKANNSVRQATVGSENAAEKIRDMYGNPVYRKLLENAKAEGAMAATSQAGLSNSTTSKQAMGLAGLLNAATEAAGSVSANPVWFATQYLRRVGTDAAKSAGKKAATKDAKVIGDMLTRGGNKNAQSVIEDLIAEMYRQEAAKSAGQKWASITTSGVSRATAPNQ